MAYGASEIEVTVSDTIRSFDCGENLERVMCPSCRSEIPIEWWTKRNDEDEGDSDGLRLVSYATPRCGVDSTLNELVRQ